MSPGRATIIVLAKAPVPGRVKTRLCPPCTPAEAAHLAEAALIDTLHAVADTPAIHPLLALDGPSGTWIPDRFPTISQRGEGLDERITAAFAAVGGPALLIGMDTPQVTPSVLDDAVGRLLGDGTDAVLGLSDDGGFWALGLRASTPRLTLGVPMSTVHTGADQLRKLVEEGCHVDMLRCLRDVDTMSDALAVARRAPTTRFAAAMSELGFTARELASA